MSNIIAGINLHEILKSTIALCVVIDIIGTIPFILKTKRTAGALHPGKTTLTVACIGVAFLFFGQELLTLYELELSSFRAAGGIVLAVLGIEMLFDIEINRSAFQGGNTPSVTPLGFPVIAGTGTLTTLILLLEDYEAINVLIAFLINLITIYMVIRYVAWIERKLGRLVIIVLTKLMGLMLLSMGIQHIKNGLGHTTVEETDIPVVHHNVPKS